MCVKAASVNREAHALPHQQAGRTAPFHAIRGSWPTSHLIESTYKPSGRSSDFFLVIVHRLSVIMSNRHLQPSNGRPSAPDGSPRSSYNSASSATGHAAAGPLRRDRMSITGLLNPPSDDEDQKSGAGQRYPVHNRASYPVVARSNSFQRSNSSQTASSLRRRDRSSTRSSPGERQRPFRPPYNEEEVQFVYYHRCDLSMDWPEITRAFNAQFPHRPVRDIQGIQCKYYRYREERHLPTVRNAEGRSNAYENRHYGLRRISGQPNLYYPWMR